MTAVVDALRALLALGIPSGPNGGATYVAACDALRAHDAQPDDADAWRDAARDEYATDELAIYDDARVDVVDGGAWVEAWAWVAGGDA